MEAAGLAPLTIPDNYYDDVGARFRLTLDLSDKLQAHSILSDEDETGRYFQIYTHVFAEQLFF
jgi:4-hydroxyphenylpyruvate dioxygenase